MDVAVNDLSFQRSLYKRQDALNAVGKFIRVCQVIESIKCHNVNRIVRANIDKETIIYPGRSIIGIVKEIPDKDKRSYFLSLLVNRGYQLPVPETPFAFNGMRSYVCAAAKNEAVVSLETDSIFAQSLLEGKIGETSVYIRNISSEDHIFEYKSLLGVRIYVANDKKHKKDRFNAYGKNIANPMGLDQEEAQELLDRAIEVRGRLYARKGKINYAFQKEQECIYHGYEDYYLPGNILSELNAVKWD